MNKLSRRSALGCAAAFLASSPLPLRAQSPFRLGLTPVFLDNDAAVIDNLRAALEAAMNIPIELEQRRTYEEVTSLLLEGTIDAAWLCGYPYLQHQNELTLLAVPVWNDQPLYQSYLIVGAQEKASELLDLKGGTHAFSDPNSNSGFLVTASDLARLGHRTETFFRRSIFTYGHRNVVRAVADGLVGSGSVDGYVWEVLTKVEPELVNRTRVISRSEWLGFPPFCARTDRMGDPKLGALQNALLNLQNSDRGRAALEILQLGGMVASDKSLFDGIAARMRDYDTLR